MDELAGMGSELMIEGNDDIESDGGSSVQANATVVVPGDCGCGCGGSGDCGGTAVAGVHHARRRFLIGGVGLSAFAATLASRPAHAALCNNLTALYSPSGSHTHAGVCNASGKTPGFWKNHAGCWPNGITPSDTFSTWFGSAYFLGSGQTLGQALCNPSSNLAYQIAAGLLNAQSPYTSPSFGYGSAQLFADSVIAAFKANSTEAPTYPSVQYVISNMNSDNSSIGAWCPQQSVCS